MYVSLLTHEWPPHLNGGAGVHAVELTEKLEALGANVDVIVYPRLDEEPEALRSLFPADASELTDTRVGVGLFSSLATARVLTDRRKNDGIIHSHTWFAYQAGQNAALSTGRPHIITAHSTEGARPWKTESRGNEYELSKWFEKSSFLAADHIIAVSKSMRDEILALYPDLDPDKVSVIYNGVDTRKWHPTNNREFLDENNIPDDYIVYLGRVTKQKGLEHFLRSLDHVPQEIGVVLCLGASDPKEYASAMSMVTALTATGRRIIVIERNYNFAELRQILSHAKLSVVPSTYEPLGIVALESFACGTPVVASCVGGLAEVVTHGTGWVVPLAIDSHTRLPAQREVFSRDLGTTIATALEDSVSLHRKGQEGLVQVQSSYGWDHIAQQTLRLYETVQRQYRGR